MSGYDDRLASQTHPVASSITTGPPPTEDQTGTARPGERSPAFRLAEELAALLDSTHGISADVHQLRCGKAVLSVYYGLLVYTDGEKFWWTTPRLSHSGGPLLTSAATSTVAAERLSEHYAILRTRPLTTVLGSELPLLADVILADHVVPR